MAVTPLMKYPAHPNQVSWVGPAEYRQWADKTFADHEKVAIKIGLWKKQ